MAISAYAFLQSTMHYCAFAHYIPDALMTAQADRIHVISHQAFPVTCMHIMTILTLSLLEWKMHITLGKTLFKLLMALITKVRDLTLNTYLSVAKATPD
jgi:hypothetical protein